MRETDTEVDAAMDAEKVFRLWRRVLRDREFGDALLAPAGREHIAALGLDADEEAIALALHAHREAAYWPREGYRYRVISAARGALLAYAPLTRRLLAAHGVDLRALATRFAESTAWRDDGPHGYRTCLDFLAYIETDAAALPEIVALRDAVALDAAACRLLRRVATIPPAQWHAVESAGEPRAGQRYQRSPLTCAIMVEHAITPWLEEADAVGKVPLVAEPQRILLQFLSTEEEPDYLIIGPNMYAIYQALERPLSLDQAIAVLGQGPDAERVARSTLRSFLQIDIIRPIAA